jgi:DNA-directed RNA polymerase subunit RPC12/RpoP
MPRQLPLIRKSPSTKLDPLGKPSFFDGRGVKLEVIKISLARIVLAPRESTSKAVLSKLKVTSSFDENIAALMTFDKPVLGAVFDHLAGDNAKERDSLVKEGVAYRIISMIANMLPYKCNGCEHEVKNESEGLPVTRTVTCASCGAGACLTCCPVAINLGWMNICSPCSDQVTTRFKTPTFFMLSSARKEEEVRTIQANPAVSQSVDDDSSEASGSASSLPLGQGKSVTATVIESDSTEEDVDIIEVAEVILIEESGSPDDQETEQFVLPAAVVRNMAKEAKKKVQKEKKVIGADEKVKEVCKHFLSNSCRHGFFGKTPKGTKAKCDFSHPTTCKKYMDDGIGTGGCVKGNKCTKLHPKMCGQSLKSRTCANLQSGGRCKSGYHVRGTKAAPAQPMDKETGSNAKPAVTQTESQSQETNASTRIPGGQPQSQPHAQPETEAQRQAQTFLWAMIRDCVREQMKALLSSAPWEVPRVQSQSQPQYQIPVQSQPPPATSQPPRQEGMSYLMALLGGQGA